MPFGMSDEFERTRAIEEQLYKMACRLRDLTVAAKAVFHKENFGDGSREWLNLRDELEVIDANLIFLPELTKVGYNPNE